jgi:hypothetical protein
MAPVPPNPRPYGTALAADLGKLLADHGDDPKLLGLLRAEAQYRIDKRRFNNETPTPTSVALLKKIDAQIEAGRSPSRRATKPPSAPSVTKPPTNEKGARAVEAQAEMGFSEGDHNGTADSSAHEVIPPPSRAEAYQQFLPPDDFTLVQPLGVRPRPSAYRPTLKNDVNLGIGKSDRPAMRFRVALAELLREMKRRHVGRQQFVLEDGERLPSDSSGFSYQFAFSEEANLFEGAKVDLIVGGQLVVGNLTGILQGRIVITLQEDFGDSIKSCILRIDNTAIIQALHDRLSKVEGGEVPAFREDFAARVLKNEGAEQPITTTTEWPWKQPATTHQQRFIEVALAHDITWLWGPPGTGKTATLSALTKILYEAGKRVLICSNTNQAVDQLLQMLCRNMEESEDPALADGKVIRLGRVGEELEREFGPFVVPDLVVARKSEELISRKAEVEAELERLGREVAYAQEVLVRFAELDTTRSAAAKKYQQLVQSEADLRTAQAIVTKEQSKFGEFVAEYEKFKAAGALRRILLRSEAALNADLNRQQARVSSAAGAEETAKKKYAALRTECENNARKLKEMETALRGEDRERHRASVAEYETRRQPLRDELATITKQLEDIRAAVLLNARIVGATITRTFLRPIEFAAFDAVIIDEASMILLPAVFLAVGLATEKVIIAGDFQQLPPILQTEQQAVHDVLAHDIFAEAGISLNPASKGKVPRLVMLDEQFRMDDSICRIVSDLFYNRQLKTHPGRIPKAFDESAVLDNRLTIIDTSRIWPFTTRNAFNSRLNLMHALAMRNLVLHLNELGRLRDADGKARLGICTPYAAQGKLMREILKAHGLDDGTVRASSVHSYQGDERALMIIDLVDSVGERNAGIFLQANQKEDSGAKLLNVALSRAQEGIVIVANLTFLDQKLPSDALLRGLLHDIQRKGRVVDVRDVLALHPVIDDLKRFGSQPDLDPECLRTGLFAGRDFAKLCRVDMEQAKKSIVVFSGFITAERAAQMGDLFRKKIAEGVKVRCVTRPPNRNGSIPEAQGRAALSALEGIGVVIDLRNDIHEKVVLIDGKIAWFGSLNPLSHTPRTSELMARIENEGVASHIASILAVKRRSAEEIKDGATAAENPRCAKCDGWSSLIRGKFGPFFACANGCEWKQSTNAVR